MLCERWTSGISSPSVNFEVAGGPALAGHSDAVTVLFQQIREGDVLCRKGTGVGPGLFNLPRVASGQEGSAAGAAAG